MKAYAILDSDQETILDIVDTDAPGRVPISAKDLKAIASSQYGHAQFKMIDSVLTEDLASINTLSHAQLIKAATSYAILSIAPEWKQRNMIARGLELTEKMATGGTLTTEEQAESDAIKATWAEIKAIREASDQAEIDGTPVDEFIDSL